MFKKNINDEKIKGMLKTKDKEDVFTEAAEIEESMTNHRKYLKRVYNTSYEFKKTQEKVA